MMNIDKMSKTIDSIQSALVWFVISLITICIGVLLTFDVLAGTGTMLYLTGNKEWQSVVISLATTGLLFALMFIGYMMITKTKNKMIMSVGKGVMGISALLYLTDIVFDSLLADILRYGLVASGVDWLQWAFRGIIGGISTVGDGLAIAMIVGMPVLKTILREALGGTSFKDESESAPTKTSVSPAVQQLQRGQQRNNGTPAVYQDRALPKINQTQSGQYPTYHPVDMKKSDLPGFMRGKRDE